MLRRSIFILALVLLLSSLATVSARPYTWTAWLHYGRHMTLVNTAGESLREVDLPTLEGYSTGNGEISVSNNGDLIAYVPSKVNTNLLHLMVYDSVNKTLLQDYTLPNHTPPFSFLEKPYFSQDDTLLAFSYRLEPDPFGASNQMKGWGIEVLNIATGQIVYQFDNTQFSSFEPDIRSPEEWSGPYVQAYGGNQIIFRLVSNDPTTGYEVKGFVWNTVTGDVHEDISLLGVPYNIFEPTQEAVGIFPNKDFTHFTLQVYDPVLHARYPFYAGDGRPETAQFVQNGERILMIDYDTDSLNLIERNGKMVNQWTSPDYFVIDSVHGIPDGFLYTAFINQSPMAGDELDIPELIEVNTLSDQLGFGQTVWHLSFAEFRKRAAVDFPLLEIVWEHDDAPVPIYEAWAQLATPVYESTPTTPQNLPAPTMIPTPEPLFRVGMTVHVQTTGGEILNLRTDHTRKADVIMYLTDKMALTLLEGPVQAEGFNWWRVRTPDGTEGWTVENNGDLQTLIPG